MSETDGLQSKDGLPVMLHLDAASFASWLAVSGKAAPGAWLMFARTGMDAISLSRQDAIDAALCEGWIDGQSARWDERFFLFRFTPRRPCSRWSQVNRQRATELIEAGRMLDAGLAGVRAAQEDGRWAAAYPPSSTAVPPPDLQVALGGDPDAAGRFAAMSRTDRYALILKLANATHAKTRARHIAGFLAATGATRDAE